MSRLEESVHMQPQPENEIGQVAASEQMLGRGDLAAIVMRLAVVYTTGVRITLSALTRQDNDLHWHDDVAGDRTTQGLLLALTWDDRATAQPEYGVARTRNDRDLSRIPISAGGGGTHYDITVWVSPIRATGGLLHLHLTWLRLGITAAHGSVPIPTRRQLASRRQLLWPR